MTAVETAPVEADAVEAPVAETPVQTEAVTTLSGVAMPELAMGKAFPLRDDAIVSEDAAANVEETVATEATVETAVAQEAPVVETPAVEAPVTETSIEPVVAPVATPAEKVLVTATSPRGKHAVAMMAKAPAPVETAEAVIVASAPLRTERLQARQAGSQTATSKATAPMASTMLN
ncbi:hypothetical protein [Photobacterium swingsii]|uniref:hypothetical protein n=1 Tax=Photobacterium swingsii TaxID=680026 RepID=UPI000B15C576